MAAVSSSPRKSKSKVESQPEQPSPTTKVDSVHKYNIEETIGGPATPTAEPEPKVEHLVTTMMPSPDTITTSPAAAAAAAAEEKPFARMLREEYEHALNAEIHKGTQRVMTRFTRLYSQERTPTDVVKDSLGNTSDFYENLVNTIQSGNTKAIGDTIEDVYKMLESLPFTEMRPLDALKQEYSQP